MSVRTVVATSIALRPRRSNFVTTSTSPSSRRSISFAKPRRSIAATDPETVSLTTRRGCTAKPAALISPSWLSVVCSGVETRR